MNDMESWILERKEQMMVKGGEEPPVEVCSCTTFTIGQDSTSIVINNSHIVDRHAKPIEGDSIFWGGDSIPIK